MTTFNVKLIPFPAPRPGTYGMAATVENHNRTIFVPSPGVFPSRRALQTKCEKANIPSLVMGMPTPGMVYSLTGAQLETLGFRLT